MIGGYFLAISTCARLGAIYFNRMRADMMTAARTFAFKEAKCREPSDRDLVERNIIEMLYVKQRIISKEPSEALPVFDELVRTRVPDYIARCMGRVGVRWRWVLIFCLVVETPSSLDMCLTQFDGVSFRGNALSLIHSVLKAATIIPFWLAIEINTVSACLRLSEGCGQHDCQHDAHPHPTEEGSPGAVWSTRLALIASFPVSVLMLFGMWLASRQLSTLGAESAAAAAAFLLLHACVALGVLVAYRPIRTSGEAAGKEEQDEELVDLEVSEGDDKPDWTLERDYSNINGDGTFQLDTKPDWILECDLSMIHEEGTVQIPTETDMRISVDLSDVHQEHKVAASICGFIIPPHASAGIQNKVVHI